VSIRIRNNTRPSPATLKGYRAGQPSPRKDRTFPAEVLTPDEVRALIGACSSNAPTGIRNRALIAVLYRSGLRVGEALALKTTDIDPDRGTIRVLHGKGDRSRTVGLDQDAIALVQRWLDRRSDLGVRNGSLFCTLDGGRLAASYVRTLLRRLALKVGIEKRVHPHALRHTHAAELVKEGVPVNLIQDQLGHASLATTDRYLRHLTAGEVVAAIQQRRWAL
jgi:site-specific recombinase XerD